MNKTLKKSLIVATGSIAAIGCVYAAYRFLDFETVAEVAGDAAETAADAAGEVAETVAEVAAIASSTILEVA